MGKNKKSNFDGIVSFDMPIHIKNDNEDEISIYGLLFNKKERHDDDLWCWELNRYLCYLQGAERVQKNGGNLAPEVFYTPSGRMIKLGLELKNLICRLMNDKRMGYRVIEFIEPLEIRPDEADDIFIISDEFIGKCIQTQVL